MSSAPKRPHDDSNLLSSSSRLLHEEGAPHPRMNFEAGPDSRAGKVPRLESRDVDKRTPILPAYRAAALVSDSHSQGQVVASSENKMESKDSKEGRESKMDKRDLKGEIREMYHQSSKSEKGRVESGKDMKYCNDPEIDAVAEKENPGPLSGQPNWKDHQRGKRHPDNIGGVGTADRFGSTSANMHGSTDGGKEGMTREIYHQSSKSEKGRVEGGKDMKYCNDPEIDAVIEKENPGPLSGQPNWKDLQRGKRHPDNIGGVGTTDRFGSTSANMHGSTDGGKEGITNVERERVENHEVMGENKLDLKGEDKYKDKDRKRKDVKHRDLGERDKERGDRRDASLGGSGNDHCEPIREERETERSEREKKDLSKDKEIPKEKETDRSMHEVGNIRDKDGSHGEKGIIEQALDQVKVSLEQNKHKETDVWKGMDKETRDKRRERDNDMGERLERHGRPMDKELDDGAGDVEGGSEREKEGFSSGVQQRKRMLRPRGSPQVANREARFKPRGLEADECQGRPEASPIIYRAGECMQELLKLWKEHESSQANKNGETSVSGPTLEIKVPGEYVTATNRQVRGGQLWGTDVYTGDSDIVAVLMHTGYCRTSPTPPPAALQEVRVIIRVLPPQDFYVSSLRNNVRSRAWGAGIGCSYQVERCFIVKKGCEPREIERSLTHSSTIEPTLAPVAVERTMTTRAAASNALRQQRFVREVTLQYNLSNEPWIKYSINIVADKGLKKPTYTSARLKKGEVLYMETHTNRYELCFAGEKMVKAGSTSQAHETETDKSQNHISHHSNGPDSDSVIDVFRFSRCKRILSQKVTRSLGIPLPLDQLEVLADNLDWEDVLWSQTGVWIGGKEYQLARVHFMAP